MSAALVEASGLTKRWGETVALSNATMSIGHGVTGLLGSNGAGKTTLMKLVLGLHRADAGKLEVLGLDPTHAGRDVRAKLGYAPEDDPLPDDVKAHDLVRHMAEVHGIPHRAANGRASDSLWLVGLGEERFRPIGTMSVGQRQRVKLAQAIAHDPELVLLDEPTNGLDPVQREEMLLLIREIGRDLGLDVILSTHLLGEVERVCDSVVVLDAGAVVVEGRLDDLREQGDELLVEVDGDARKLVTALKRRGAKAKGSVVTIPLNGETTYDAVRDALVTTGLPLRRLRRRTASLEDILFDTTS